ncbi:hypothetical protein Trydic_g20975 [Trypoxylus dichotomus]
MPEEASVVDEFARHSSCAIFWIINITIGVPQLPYLPDLGPVNFFLLPKLKCTVERCHLDTIEEIEKASMKEIFSIPTETTLKATDKFEQKAASSFYYNSHVFC